MAERLCSQSKSCRPPLSGACARHVEMLIQMEPEGKSARLEGRAKSRSPHMRACGRTVQQPRLAPCLAYAVRLRSVKRMTSLLARRQRRREIVPFPELTAAVQQDDPVATSLDILPRVLVAVGVGVLPSRHDTLDALRIPRPACRVAFRTRERVDAPPLELDRVMALSHWRMIGASARQINLTDAHKHNK